MYTYVDSIEDLNILNKELLEKSYVGIDTEFRRTTKDNMKLALLQVNDGEEIYLIDAISIDNPEDSCNFLYSDSVIKILHSCKEDLEAIYSWTGYKMVNLFDTQLANAFLGGDFSIGYQGLVDEKLDIKLDKRETRSNWTRRPLSDSQLSYAVSDVEYLIHLYLEQERLLTATKKMVWFKEDVEFLISRTFFDGILSEEAACPITKSEEKELLNQFNEIVLNISQKIQVNSTLFFSKRFQKEFVRLALVNGTEEAYREITSWRRGLIKESFDRLILEI